MFGFGKKAARRAVVIAAIAEQRPEIVIFDGDVKGAEKIADACRGVASTVIALMANPGGPARAKRSRRCSA